MFCKNCGKELADGAAFCAECGTRVEPVSAAPAATTAEPVVETAAEPTLSAEPVQTAAPVQTVAPQPETPVYTAPAQPEVQPNAQPEVQPAAQPFAQPVAQQPVYAAQPAFGAPAAAKKPVYKQWWFYTVIAAAVAVIVAAAIIILTSANALVGTWKIHSVEVNGQKLTMSEFEKFADAAGMSDDADSIMDMKIELKSDGKATLSMGDNSETMDWEETENGVKIDEVECKVDNGVMCLEESYSGLKIYFEKD